MAIHVALYYLCLQTFIYLAKDVTIDDITSANVRALEKSKSAVAYPLRLASEGDVINILKDISIRNKLFPDNVCVTNYEPFDPVPENAFMMLRPYNWCFVGVNQTGQYDSLSIMTTEIDIPAGCLFHIDYYGKNSSIVAIQHVMKHLQKLRYVYTKGPVTVRLTTPDVIKYQDLKNDAAFLKLNSDSLSEKMYILETPIKYKPAPKL